MPCEDSATTPSTGPWRWPSEPDRWLRYRAREQGNIGAVNRPETEDEAFARDVIPDHLASIGAIE